MGLLAEIALAGCVRSGAVESGKIVPSSHELRQTIEELEGTFDPRIKTAGG